MKFPSILFLASLSLLGGCALVYSYGDYKDQGAGGSGGAAASSSKASSTGSHASSSGTGGKAASSSSTSASSAGGAGGSASSSGTGGSATSSGTGGSTSTSTSTSTSSSSGCAGGDTCVSVPAGWTGPAVLGSGSSCPQGWTAIAFAGGTSFSTPTGCTPCACPPQPTGGTCPTSVDATGFSGTGCNGGIYSLSSSMTLSCSPLGQTLGSVQGFPTAATGAMCPASTATSMPNAQPVFTATETICTGSTGAACNGGVCAPPAAQICFYASGAMSCPAGYPNKTLIYTGIDSTYSCTMCTCGLNAPPTCMPTTALYSDANTCMAPIKSFTNNGNCVTVGVQVDAYELTSTGQPSGGSCVASGGELTGSAAGTGTMTVCCSS